MILVSLTGRRSRKTLILLQALVLCALLTAPVGASLTLAASGRLNPALCPMRTVASGYANARGIPTPALHAHSMPADDCREHPEQANAGLAHAEQASPEHTHAEHAHSGHEHSALAHAGQEHAGGGDSGHARHDAPPAQENDCRCDPYSMSRCFSFTPPALLSSGEAFIRPAQHALHEPRNEIPVKSLHADNLFRPPRIPAA
ncbi:MAG: hypothetical protein LBC55_04810 [Desulfovibrio sp.]|jgi:hypothetical protein|nr:hypothetical protein [Desulfovibrio sp.]